MLSLAPNEVSQIHRWATHNAWIRSANSISLLGGGKLNVVVRLIQGSSSCLAVNRVRLSLDNDPVGI